MKVTAVDPSMKPARGVSLHPDTLLRRVPELAVQLRPDGRIEIALAGRRVPGGPHALQVLEVFARPTSVRAALELFVHLANGTADWAAFAQTMYLFAQEGVLIDEAESTAKVRVGPDMFHGASAHVRMLNDRVRTSRWIEAVQATVRPGDVVVEVGTGTGVLAIAAARAGARRVYAIEGGNMAAIARELVRANGVADKVTIVEGWSSEVSLPERGDVFVTETIGSLAFEEGIHSIVADSLARHLKPGARVIPRDLRLHARPVMAPEKWLSWQEFRPAMTQAWTQMYGIDFSRLAELPHDYETLRRLVQAFPAAWRTLGDPVCVAAAKFEGGVQTQFNTINEIALSNDGELNALSFFLTSELAPGIAISTDPLNSSSVTPDSWATLVGLVEPRSVRVGDRIIVEFAWDDLGTHRCRVRTAGSK